MTKAKAIRMPGKVRPAASQLGIQKPRRRSFTLGISQTDSFDANHALPKHPAAG